MRQTEPGTLPLGVLEQTDVWQDVTGRVRRLADLDTSHLRNLIPFLRKHGEDLRWKWFEMHNARHSVMVPTVIAHVDGEDILGPPFPLFSDNGGNMDGAFNEWMDSEFDRPFDEWLEARPLVKAIRQEIAKRPPEPIYSESAPF